MCVCGKRVWLECVRVGTAWRAALRAVLLRGGLCRSKYTHMLCKHTHTHTHNHTHATTYEYCSSVPHTPLLIISSVFASPTCSETHTHTHTHTLLALCSVLLFAYSADFLLSWHPVNVRVCMWVYLNKVSVAKQQCIVRLIYEQGFVC